MQTGALSVDQLAAFCEEEQAKFKRGETHDPQYCFELFMRASTETGQIAFNAIYQLFNKEVENWVLRHPAFYLAGESAEWFVNAALGNFYHQMRKPAFQVKSTSLGGVLTFLQMCVHSVIAEEIRRKRVVTDDDDDQQNIDDIPDPAIIEEDLIIQQLWECIRAALADEKAMLLAYLTFALAMPPREIDKLYPNTWKDVRKHVHRIRKKLRIDPDFRTCMGL